MSINETLEATCGKLNFAVLVLPVLLLMLGCSSCCTKPKTATIFGQVELVNDTGNGVHDPVDFAGVTIALYELAELDSTLTRLNSEYPGIGVGISQSTDFDHRCQSPLAIVSSTGDGSFSLNEISSGTYNVALFKEGWGIRYIHNVQVSENMDTSIGDIDLYPEVIFTSASTEPVTLKSDHTYVIYGDMVFIGPVEFQARSRLYAEPGSIIKFYGELTCSDSTEMDDIWKILSSDALYSTTQTELGLDSYISSVQFYGDIVNINNGAFYHIGNSVLLAASDCTISNAMVRFGGSGFSISDSNSQISNILVSSNVKDNVYWGTKIQSSTPVDIEVTRSIFKNLEEGVHLNGFGTFSVNNSYFHGNDKGIQARHFNGSVTHNAFELNEVDVYQYILYDPPTEIAYNNFYLTKVRTVYPLRVATINNNNFYHTLGIFITIRITTLPNNSCVTADLDARNNYWGVANLSDYLVDANDNTGDPESDCPFYILYQPRINVPIQAAGIELRHRNQRANYKP